MYEMSFFWNNDICCGCTGFLHILWAFTEENVREEEGRSSLFINWMQEFPTARREGGSVTCMSNPSSVLVGKATSIKWAAQISLPGRGRPVSQQVARAPRVASDLFEGAQRWWKYVCEDTAWADLAWILATSCVFLRGLVENNRGPWDPSLPHWQEYTAAALGARRTPASCEQQRAANLPIESLWICWGANKPQISPWRHFSLLLQGA